MGTVPEFEFDLIPQINKVLMPSVNEFYDSFAQRVLLNYDSSEITELPSSVKHIVDRINLYLNGYKVPDNEILYKTHENSEITYLNLRWFYKWCYDIISTYKPNKIFKKIKSLLDEITIDQKETIRSSTNIENLIDELREIPEVTRENQIEFFQKIGEYIISMLQNIVVCETLIKDESGEISEKLKKMLEEMKLQSLQAMVRYFREIINNKSVLQEVINSTTISEISTISEIGFKVSYLYSSSVEGIDSIRLTSVILNYVRINKMLQYVNENTDKWLGEKKWMFMNVNQTDILNLLPIVKTVIQPVLADQKYDHLRESIETLNANFKERTEEFFTKLDNTFVERAKDISSRMKEYLSRNDKDDYEIDKIYLLFCKKFVYSEEDKNKIEELIKEIETQSD